MKDKNKTKKTSGSGLIFAVVLLFVILGMVITLSSVTMLETKMNQKTKSSVGAFYGSESGVEWALNKIATSSDTINSAFITTGFNTDGSAKCPATFGTNACKVYFLDSNGKVLASDANIDQVKAVRSVGTQGDDTQRAIEAAVASGSWSGTYVVWGTRSCNSGETKLYEGSATLPISQSNGPSGVICLKGSIADYKTLKTTGDNLMWASWVSGSGAVAIENLDMPCAVCAQ